MNNGRKCIKYWIFGFMVMMAIFPVIVFSPDFPKIPEGWSEGFVYAKW